MRIITGSAKGLKLKTPKGMDVRPTSDRVKESIFNILAGKVHEAYVADLFAGTGNLGVEALSRGAKGAVFIDSSSTSMNLVKENTARARLSEKAEFFKSDAVGALDKFFQQSRMFDLMFCDPPYNKGLVSAVLHKIDTANVLTPGGIIVVEHSKHEALPSDLQHLEVRRTERYGETLVSFVTHHGE